MNTTIVTVICSIGVGLGFLVVVVRRDGRATSLPVAHEARLTTRTVEQLRQLCAVLAAGFVGGLVGFGLGGRLMMRVLAVTSPDASGRLTDAGEIVGEVSTGGTVFLVLFLTTPGLLGALAYHALRRALPTRSLPAGAIVGAIGGGLLIRLSGLLSPENRDFEILGPTWLAVVLCIAVIAIGALFTAVLVDRWIPRWPAPARSVRGIAGLAPLLVCIFIPVGVAAALVLAIRTAAARRTAPTSLERLGRTLLRAGALAGAIWITISGVAILG